MVSTTILVWKSAEFKAKHKGIYFSKFLLIAHVSGMIKWVGNFNYKSFATYFNYKSFATCIFNNTYIMSGL